MSRLENYVKGRCMTMCPVQELESREKDKLLHILEMVPGTERTRKPLADPQRVVKMFSRSAAGQAMQNEDSLIPTEVLLTTINYLLFDIASNHELPWHVIYDFIMDRLRAVRQDMIIQNLSKADSISILQPIVRFYAYASYRLCEEKIIYFDQHLNITHLQECLKRLLSMFDDCDDLYFKLENAENILSDSMVNNRSFFEALYVIFNLGNETAIRRVLKLHIVWRSPIVKEAMEMSLKYMNGNFVGVCRIMRDLPPLLAALASLHLPEIRRKTLERMSVAYSTKNLGFPLNELTDLLLYNSQLELTKDCKHYGIDFSETQIFFRKQSFLNQASSVPPRKQKFVDEKLENFDIPTLLMYNN